MKRIGILLLVLLLSACGSSSLSWKDVEEDYAKLETAVKDPLENETFLKQDFEEILDAIRTGTEGLSFGIRKDETATAEELYTAAIRLEKAASFTDSEYSLKLRSLAEKVKQLVAAAYDKTSAYDTLQYEVNLDLNEIEDWEEENWLQTVKKKRLKWADLEEEFLALEEETIDGLTSPKKVTENELEEYKDTILKNYAQIEKGVSEDTLPVTKEMYAAAIALRQYTEKLKGSAGEKVCAFAVQTIEYIQEKLGMTVDDPDYDYSAQIQSAQKWTLSTLNELTMLMRQ